MKRRWGIVGSMVSVGGVLILIKILGFVRQMVVATVFGATADTDLVTLSQSFVGNAQYVLTQALLTAMVPIYVRLREEKPSSAGSFATDVLKSGTLISGAIALVLFICSPLLARLLAPTYTPVMTARLSAYLRTFSWTLIPLVWMAAFHGALNANKRFIPGQLERLYQSIIIMAMAIFFSARLGVNALVVGFCLYILVSTVITGVQARRYFLPSGTNPLRSPHIHSLLTMIGPLLIGYGAIYVNQIVDKILISGLESGAVTAVGYASTLTDLISTLIASLCTVLYSHMAEAIAQGKTEAAAHLIQRSVLILTLILLPVTIITVCQAEDIISLLYGRGAFGVEEIQMSALALSGYGCAFIPMAWKEIYARVQYGYQNSRQPTRNSIVGILVNLVLSILLCPRYGVLGVTLASSVATLVMGVLNMVTAQQCMPGLSMTPLFQILPFLCVGGGISVFLCIKCNALLADSHAFVQLCLTSICVFLVYGVIISPLLWKLSSNLRYFRNK